MSNRKELYIYSGLKLGYNIRLRNFKNVRSTEFDKLTETTWIDKK